MQGCLPPGVGNFKRRWLSFDQYFEQDIHKGSSPPAGTKVKGERSRLIANKACQWLSVAKHGDDIERGSYATQHEGCPLVGPFLLKQGH